VSGQKEPTLYIVEEPELHLHPAAHAQLADLYLRAAKTTGNRFLIETHSESLLLRLRRRIAEELASPDDVGVYFVEHDGRTASARRIFVDESGMLSFWPDGVFTEDFEEVRALTQAQMRRSASRVG
jgi:predicted ATPase